MSEQRDRQHFLSVAVLTTSGRYPDEGFIQVPQHQPVKAILQKASKNLDLTDTEGWIARVNDLEIDTRSSYEANRLRGEIVLDWGPSEGGGGA